MNHADLLKQLFPPVTYDITGRILSAQLTAEGAALDAVLGNSAAVADEADPRSCYTTLVDWERVAGLPDTCMTGAALNLAARRQRLVDRLTTAGGSTVSWMLKIASQLGYSGVTVDEFAMPTCVGDCNQFVYSTDWRFAFRVNVPGGLAVAYATCQSSCVDALASWVVGEFECRINRIKPAHTVALVNWF
jgi:uncharacterized protein YmfQ (DUF2313 family)